jgi:hypothetical protein
MTDPPVPVVLFAYKRVDTLEQTLAGLQRNEIPLLYAFSDGPRREEDLAAVERVRDVLRSIDWCQLVLHERHENLGLGRSIRGGVSAVLEEHPSLIVMEDDLASSSGLYQYLSAALRAYADDERVMSVTGWTHPAVTPPGVTSEPYFDGRAESWSWGTWRRAWQGMDQTAAELMALCSEAGISIDRYGDDLPEMAKIELTKNLWAVRFAYLHILRGGLVVRPPWTMVDHIGFDAEATNASGRDPWAHGPLRPAPPIPTGWPVPAENPECAALWQRAFRDDRGVLHRALSEMRSGARRFVHRLGRTER